MKEIRVYKPIDKEDIFWSWLTDMEGGESFTFSADTIHKIFDENPEETVVICFQKIVSLT